MSDWQRVEQFVGDSGYNPTIPWNSYPSDCISSMVCESYRKYQRKLQSWQIKQMFLKEGKKNNVD